MPQPGDVILFQGTGLLGTAIRWCQRRRPSLRPYANFTHCGIYVDPPRGGGVIEAVRPRIRFRPLLPGEQYSVLHLDVTPMVRARIVAAARSQIRTRYGVTDVLSFGFTLLTGKHIPFRDADDLWCSESVMRCLHAGGLALSISPEDTAPASLPLDLNIVPSRP